MKVESGDKLPRPNAPRPALSHTLPTLICPALLYLALHVAAKQVLLLYTYQV